MDDTAKCPNPLGPIPTWVRERWMGDLPYPKVSLAHREAIKGEDATNRRAAKDLAKNVPDFEISAHYERIYLDRSGGVYRLHSRDIVDAIFSSRTMAASWVRRHGYTRLPAHDTNIKLAYERKPNG